MTIVMGLDQHRAQITAEWIDTETGEIERARIAPAHRAPVRRFLHAFRRRGSRGRAGGDDGLAVRGRGAARDRRGARIWPSRRRPRRGAARRSAPRPTARDARHLRELLMIGAAAGVVDPARAPARSARQGPAASHAVSISAASGSSASRRCSITTALPPRRDLLDAREPRVARAGRAAGETAREQVTVALAMIDALDAQIAPLSRELRAYARRQAGCRALMAPLRHRGADRGDDPRRARRLPALLVLAPRRPLLRAGHHRAPVRPAPRPRAPLPPGAAGAALGAVRGRPGRAPPRLARTATTTPRPPSASAATAPAWPSRASCSSAATTRCANSARRRCSPPDHLACARSPHSHRCTAAGSPHAPAATTWAWTALKDRAAATHHPAGSPHQPSCRRPAARRARGPR